MMRMRMLMLVEKRADEIVQDLIQPDTPLQEMNNKDYGFEKAKTKEAEEGFRITSS